VHHHHGQPSGKLCFATPPVRAPLKARVNRLSRRPSNWEAVDALRKSIPNPESLRMHSGKRIDQALFHLLQAGRLLCAGFLSGRSAHSHEPQSASPPLPGWVRRC